MLMKITIPGKRIDQSQLHPVDRTQPTYMPDTNITIVVEFKPQVGDQYLLGGVKYKLKNVFAIVDKEGYAVPTVTEYDAVAEIVK